jgi:hypothetical protein
MGYRVYGKLANLMSLIKQSKGVAGVVLSCNFCLQRKKVALLFAGLVLAFSCVQVLIALSFSFSFSTWRSASPNGLLSWGPFPFRGIGFVSGFHLGPQKKDVAAA